MPPACLPPPHRDPLLSQLARFVPALDPTFRLQPNMTSPADADRDFPTQAATGGWVQAPRVRHLQAGVVRRRRGLACGAAGATPMGCCLRAGGAHVCTTDEPASSAAVAATQAWVIWRTPGRCRSGTTSLRSPAGRRRTSSACAAPTACSSGGWVGQRLLATQSRAHPGAPLGLTLPCNELRPRCLALASHLRAASNAQAGPGPGRQRRAVAGRDLPRRVPGGSRAGECAGRRPVWRCPGRRAAL